MMWFYHFFIMMVLEIIYLKGIEVEEALTKCVQEDASFIQNILDTIEKDKEMTSRALGICLLNKYFKF